VVAAVGTTVTEPERAKAVWSSARIDGVIVTELALVLFQEIVVVCPCAMIAGWAVMLIVAGPAVGVGVGLGVGLGPGLPPPTPLQPVKANNVTLRSKMNSTRTNSGLGMASHTSGNMP
jgi:hypothetical protein